MRKKRKILIGSLTVVFTLIIIVMTYLLTGTYKPTTKALDALNSNNEVKVEVKDNYMFFDGKGQKKAIIFYPGGKVDYRSYAPLMRELAKSGTDAFLVKMPFNLAILDVDKAEEITTAYKYDKLYLGGHSVGGAAAAMHASKNIDKYKGIMLLGAYSTKPLKGNDDFKVLVVYGSNDKVASKDKINEGRKYLPKGYIEKSINGGNHAWFGEYGVQKGDGKATISHKKQVLISVNLWNKLVK